MPDDAKSAGKRSRRAAWVMPVGLLLLLTACGHTQNGTGLSAETDGSFDSRVVADIADASAHGASDAQLALLEKARREGKVSVEVSREARRGFSACAAAAGVKVTFTESTRPDGWLSAVTIVDGSTKAAAEQIANTCEQKESAWVSALYDTQPIAVQATTDFLNQQAPALRTCLEAAGFKPKPDASGLELATLTVRTDDSQMRDAGRLCLHKIGVDGF